MTNDNHNNIIEACIPKKDARVDDLYYAIYEAIEDNKGGLSRAAVVGVLEIIKADWVSR